MGQSTVVSRVSTNEKMMALTFDDGSTSTNTTYILDILDKYNIKCTFFITGENAIRNPGSVKMILQRGHEIGNHSYSHPHLRQLTADETRVEIEDCKTAMMIAADTTASPLFRPPYGEYNSTSLTVADSCGYPWTLMWTIDTIDWNGTPAEAMINKVLTNSQPGAIVLMHVSGTYTKEALPKMIEGLHTQGYTLTKISDLLLNAVHPLLKTESTGEQVEGLQSILIRLGYNPGQIDGIFGSKTAVAVKDFQTANKLIADGIVGKNTWLAIDKALLSPPKLAHPLLKTGSSGISVRYLQHLLSKLGYSPGAIDGIFGNKTLAAVKAFQSDHVLVVDGIVGSKTWAELEKD